MNILKNFVKNDESNIKIFLLYESTNLKNKLKKNKITCPKNVYNDFNGKEKEIIQFYNKKEIIILLGLGKKENANIDRLGHIVKHLGFLLTTMKNKNKVYFLEDGDIDFYKDQVQLLLENHFEKKKMMSVIYKSKKNNNNKKTKKNINDKIYFITDKYLKDLNNFLNLIDSKRLVKYLGDAPSNILTPLSFVKIIKTYSKKYDYSVNVLGDKSLKKLGMNTLLSVSQGSKYGGYLVKIHSNTINKKEKPIVLVGKGITFDSGGNSIKSSEGMIDMKNDMLGAATILGVITYLSKMKIKKNVIGLLAIAENMPGKNATKPGDVIKSHSGKLVEIVDTDAEGRLVMADAISYAHKFNPKLIIDVAGLTGQQESLSAGLFASIMGNNKKKIRDLINAGEKSNERLVELPIYEENMEQTKSEIADVRNFSYDDENMTIFAGAFLNNFVKENQDWIHIDIAGPEYRKKGSTGFGVRMLVDYLSN